jgi:hypothetical protein
MKEKTLRIYKKNDEFVLERVNEFNHSTKRFFITEAGLLEALDGYAADKLEAYRLDVSENLRTLLANHLGQGGF